MASCTKEASSPSRNPGAAHQFAHLLLDLSLGLLHFDRTELDSIHYAGAKHKIRVHGRPRSINSKQILTISLISSALIRHDMSWLFPHCSTHATDGHNVPGRHVRTDFIPPPFAVIQPDAEIMCCIRSIQFLLHRKTRKIQS